MSKNFFKVVLALYRFAIKLTRAVATKLSLTWARILLSILLPLFPRNKVNHSLILTESSMHFILVCLWAFFTPNYERKDSNDLKTVIKATNCRQRALFISNSLTSLKYCSLWLRYTCHLFIQATASWILWVLICMLFCFALRCLSFWISINS